MRVIFNKRKVASRGDKKDPDNTPAKMVWRRKAMLTKMGKFMGADRIRYYEPHAKAEHYIITKGKETLTLVIGGNAFDGGWLSVE